MKLLLDTHVWLWILESPNRIPTPTRTALQDADELFLSVASVWEIAIKVALGKLALRHEPRAIRAEILTETGAR